MLGLSLAMTLGNPTLNAGGGVLTFSDDFNRATETLSASPNWTFVSGTEASVFVNGSNSLDATDVGLTGTAYQSPDLHSANHWTQATVAAVISGDGPFLCARLQDVNNWVGVRWNNTAWQLYKRVGGTLTLLGSTPDDPVVNDVVRIIASGDTVSVTINGVEKITGTLDGNLAGITRQGIVARNVAKQPWIDNYAASVFF